MEHVERSYGRQSCESRCQTAEQEQLISPRLVAVNGQLGTFLQQGGVDAVHGDRGGSSILGQALAQRKERIVTAVPLSQQEAQSMAKSRYRERARRFVTGKGTANGDPRIRVGTTLNITGLGPMFDGKYYVTLARHAFDQRSGYRTTFETSRPGIGG